MPTKTLRVDTVAQAYLEFLYTPQGQEIIAQHYFRPRNPEVAAKYAAEFARVELVEISHFGGWKIAQLMPLIPSPALQDPPHIVLLMIGTNDIAQNDNLANAPERLGELIDALIEEAPEALIVVAKITPLSFGGSGVGAYNDAIPAVVEERAADGKHVVLVDQFEGFPTSELGDGVHPNQKGYERMAGVWYEAIEDSLP